MKFGMPIPYAAGFKQSVEGLQALEDAGLDVVTVPEAYTFDAVSHLGYIAARTSRVELATSILNIYSRTPALLAMTAAGLDHVSDGRFSLGIGSSGPQVIEGFHGVPFHAPLGRTREVVAICRQVWAREKVELHGRHYDVPLTPERGGSGLGKSLKLINQPVRPNIPMTLAALGPKNIALAAELFEAWQPIFYHPELAGEVFGEPLAEGRARRDPLLPDLRVIADAKFFLSGDEHALEAARAKVRASLALYLGGMGARGKNFYHQLVTRLGFGTAANEIQDRYLGGSKDAAAAAVPDTLIERISLVGGPDHIEQRVAAYAAAGVDQLNLSPVSTDNAERARQFAHLRKIADAVTERP
ncbi:LLM class F420-dependent oxidoreductase [Actinomadura craniellae]|uniref:LLM class F420-dependent oxidoreductase n=1 Tax=Actinomadura craniellae TaxID=2231787 RepID=A0A365GVC5_9ACTN|nr:LLM class F420-dependent oxidoreductase [Actinomadura craniellae]RAY10750.1 LLM class F420-dependent oxidoreductase [Actinomadura craniellae]